jgi:hypothetical protein
VIETCLQTPRTEPQTDPEWLRHFTWRGKVGMPGMIRSWRDTNDIAGPMVTNAGA